MTLLAPLRFLLKFLEAIIPSSPNSLETHTGVRSFRGLTFTSVVCRNASITESRIARLAGIQAARRTDSRQIKAATMSIAGFSTRCILAVPSGKKIRENDSLKRRSVIPIPAQPKTKPDTIPMPERISASLNTTDRICFFVAPIDFSMPNCRVLSLTEIENEL